MPPPLEAIDYCLKAFNLSALNDVDLIVHSSPVNIASAQHEKFSATIQTQTRIVKTGHHEAHASSAFFCSPFDSAAVLVTDGVGDWVVQNGVSGYETESLYVGEGNQLRRLQRTVQSARWYKSLGRIQDSCGIGRLYLMATQYIGYKLFEEGKTMGLAPYGTGRLLRETELGFWAKIKDGNIVCNHKPFLDQHFPYNVARVVKKSGNHSRKLELGLILGQIINRMQRSRSFRDYFGNKECTRISRLNLARPHRENNDPVLPDDYYTEVAYTVQYVLEEMLIQLAQHLYTVTGQKNLCLAGGVALNSVANKKILDRSPFENIWIQPAASDTGIALGCALWGKHIIGGETHRWEMRNAYLGREYCEDEILNVVARSSHAHRLSKDVCRETAGYIAEGKIVGWFQGRSEYGPRALGNRSILADARNPAMKDILNHRVKHREAYRPFAPVILLDHVQQYFEIDRESPFMLLVAKVREGKEKVIPAVTHVDQTARVQTLTAEKNGILFNLVNAFYEKTGVPVIINTSFNVAGEPIVETPSDAYACFDKTGIDILVLGNHILTKN